MTMRTMTADTTSSAAPWPSEMNQNARVARAWRAVKLRASTSRVVAAPAKSPSGRSPYASGRCRTICASGTPRASTTKARGDGRPAPAEAGERQRDDRREQAAGGHAHAADAQRQRPAPAEPGDDGHADGQVAAQARAQRHHEERQEEHDGAVDAGEEQEAHAEDGHADADERARAETIRQPALHGTEDAALRARHCEGRRHDRLAPAELLA